MSIGGVLNTVGASVNTIGCNSNDVTVSNDNSADMFKQQVLNNIGHSRWLDGSYFVWLTENFLVKQMLSELSLVSSHTHLLFQSTVRGILLNWMERNDR
jgi:hypothetical protein